MSKVLSLKMDDRIFRDAEALIKKIRIPRNAYINHAVEFYTRCQKRRLLKSRLEKDVALLRAQTRDVLDSFELLEDIPAC